MSQVISNLVINAQQAMPDGGTISIEAGNSELSGVRQIRIIIKDNGIGIAPQHLERIFDPYFSTKQKGSGLGLASAYSIISKHKGKIQVESKLNEGTLFTIYLPSTEKKADDNIILKKGHAGAAESHARVLVLEDEKIVSNVLGKMLDRMGCTAVFAAEGSYAVKLYLDAYKSESRFDLVITDLTIPGGMGGREASQEILKINPHARLIVSSGYATDPVMASYADYGFKGIVVKPYHFRDLQAVVEKVLAIDFSA
jgi:CheY-like chemotaxis protein